MKHDPVEPDILQSIQGYSKRTIEMMTQGGAADFDYSEKSVKFLSGVIDEEGPTYSDKAKQMLPTVWGSYLGDAIIKKYGGKWVKFGSDYGVLVDGKNLSFPMTKVAKHIANGQVDSIYAFYVVAGAGIEEQP